MKSGQPTRFVDDYLGYLLGQANHALYKDFDAHVRAAGLSSIEWRVLATLHDGEPLTVSQLAHEVLSKQPTVTKLVQRMHEQGWVALQADAADQRCTLVVATASGKKLVKPWSTRPASTKPPCCARWRRRKGRAQKTPGQAGQSRLTMWLRAARAPAP